MGWTRQRENVLRYQGHFHSRSLLSLLGHWGNNYRQWKGKTKKRELANPDGQAPNGSVGANSSKVFANNVMQSLYHTEQRLRLLAFEMHSSPVSIWGKTASIVLALAWFPVFDDLSLATELHSDYSLSWLNFSLCAAQLWDSVQSLQLYEDPASIWKKKVPLGHAILSKLHSWTFLLFLWMQQCSSKCSCFFIV